jgi:3-phenylpropionate/trans-cinnamate dioxygenase ferredoxin subunit
MSAPVRIAPLAAFSEGEGVRVEVGEHRVAMFRVGGEIYAIGDRCSHAEASLAEGELFDFDVECPRHGSEFDIRTGRPGSFPATRPVPVYSVSVVDDEVFLEIGEAS